MSLYLTLSVALDRERRMTCLLVTNELERVWKGVVMN